MKTNKQKFLKRILLLERFRVILEDALKMIYLRLMCYFTNY